MAGARSSKKVLKANSWADHQLGPDQASSLAAADLQPRTDAAASAAHLPVGQPPASQLAPQPDPVGLAKPKRASGFNTASLAVGRVSAFFAKALSQLTDDAHLLEALQDLLAAMDWAVPSAANQDAAPLASSSADAPVSLGHSEPASVSLTAAKQGTEAIQGTSAAAHVQDCAGAEPAVKEEQPVPAAQQSEADALPAVDVLISADANILQPLEQPAVGPVTGSAPSGKAALPKRLKGGAAVLAKILRLDLVALAKQQPQSGQSGNN